MSVNDLKELLIDILKCIGFIIIQIAGVSMLFGIGVLWWKAHAPKPPAMLPAEWEINERGGVSFDSSYWGEKKEYEGSGIGPDSPFWGGGSEDERGGSAGDE